MISQYLNLVMLIREYKHERYVLRPQSFVQVNTVGRSRQTTLVDENI